MWLATSHLYAGDSYKDTHSIFYNMRAFTQA